MRLLSNDSGVIESYMLQIDVAFLKGLRIGINETITLKHVGHQSSVKKCNTVSFMIPQTAAASVEIYP